MRNKTLSILKLARAHMFKTDIQISSPYIKSGYFPVILFVLSIFFYVAYLLAMQPSWVLGGEMWAEMATNYFQNANSPSYYQKLFATDAGYIPAPQRLIALAGNLLNLPASAIPYFYTWSAVFITGIMVGVFCLPQFRTVMRNDALRFITTIAILMVADFETRTFINFTYFSAFFVAIITALAMSSKEDEVPWWAWFIPILMVSKPAVLAILPAMIVVAFVKKSRFRWITIATVVLCMAQLVQMLISQKVGMMSQANEITFLSKISSTVQYFFGLLGVYLLGPIVHLNKFYSMFVGLLFVFVSGVATFRMKNNANSLIFIGLSLLFFNVLLNSFALSDSWNDGMHQLNGLPIYRHIMVGFYGCVLVVVGLLASLTDAAFVKSENHATRGIVVLVFVVWFTGSGWLSFAGKINREPSSPTINNSQWQNMALAIDNGVSPICVPIDPLGWVYSKDCMLHNSEFNWVQGFDFTQVPTINDSIMFEALPPNTISEKSLISLAILARPLSTQSTFINAKAIISLRDGTSKYYFGGRHLAISGGLIQLVGKDKVIMSDISTVKVVFSSPVEIALLSKEQNASSRLLWMWN